MTQVAAWATRHARTVGRTGIHGPVTQPTGEYSAELVTTCHTSGGVRETGSLAATAREDGTVVLAATFDGGFDGDGATVWDATGAVIMTVRSGGGPTHKLAFVFLADNGICLATTTADDLHLWSISTGTRVRFYGRQRLMWWHSDVAAGQLPDGRSILAASRDVGVIGVWDAATGAILGGPPVQGGRHRELPGRECRRVHTQTCHQRHHRRQNNPHDGPSFSVSASVSAH
jgi:hypothetical protein